MNERILELAEQAGMTDDKFGMYFAKDKHDEDGVDLEKFAELIVRKCAELSRSHQDFPETEQTIRRWVAEDIERHFGVE